MNHEKEHKQEALGEYKIIHPSLHLSIRVYAYIMLLKASLFSEHD